MTTTPAPRWPGRQAVGYVFLQRPFIAGAFAAPRGTAVIRR